MNPNAEVKRVLNVGGGSRQIALPPAFDSFERLLLDIDPAVSPDVLCDARHLASLEIGQFDAVYCSHNLEHYYRHDVRAVLTGFLHVLKPGGFAYVAVPDVMGAMRLAIERGIDLDDDLYDSAAGPIILHDVLFGYSIQIERSGVDFYAHKTGFSRKSINAAFRRAGFSIVYDQTNGFQITAIAFKGQPDEQNLALLQLPRPPRPAPAV